MGINPDPYSLRELVWMAHGKQSSDWLQTAWISYMVAQVQTKEKLKFEDFDLYGKINKKKSKPRDRNAWKSGSSSWLS